MAGWWLFSRVMSITSYMYMYVPSSSPSKPLTNREVCSSLSDLTNTVSSSAHRCVSGVLCAHIADTVINAMRVSISACTPVLCISKHAVQVAPPTLQAQQCSTGLSDGGAAGSCLLQPGA